MKHLKRDGKIFITLSALAIVIGAITLYYFFGVLKSTPDTINMEETNGTSFSACLKENDYYDEKCSYGDRNYLAELLDYVDIDFKYNLDYSVLVNNDYKYSIYADIIATSKSDESKELYHKTEVLMNGKNISNTSSSIGIDEKIRIDYDKYNSIINNYKKDYVISLSSKLVVSLTIEYVGTFSKAYSNLELNRFIKVEIPLGDQTVSIKSDNNYTNTRVLYRNVNTNDNSKIIIYSLYVMEILIGTMLIISFVKLLPKKSAYQTKIHKLLTQYDQAIVVLTTKPELDDYTIMAISTFEELLDARDNFGKPIIYYEDEEEKISYFTLTNDKEAYVFTIKESDYE